LKGGDGEEGGSSGVASGDISVTQSHHVEGSGPWAGVPRLRLVRRRKQSEKRAGPDQKIGETKKGQWTFYWETKEEH